MAYDKKSVIAAYQKTGNLKGACSETGAPPYIAFIWLKKAGLLTSNDKCNYGTRGQQLGAEAEKEFQRLVPQAMSANKHLQDNCPAFDFDIFGTTVDVKYSSIRNSSAQWGFKTANAKALKPDFYVAFFATDTSGDLKDGYRVFVFPDEVFGGRTNISLSPHNSKSEWLDFEIEPEKLRDFFEEEIHA